MEEAHPVPQNVTSFQFHLVGDMTIKQFIYLAAGLGLAYLLFVLLLPISPIIALPLIGLSASLGTAFAFLPIQERPLDHWLKAYIHAIMAPTQRYWSNPNNPKQKVTPQDLTFRNKLQLYLGSMAKSNKPAQMQPSPIQQFPRVNPGPANYPSNPSQFNNPAALNQPQPQIQTQPQTQTFLPSAEELRKLVDQARQAQILQVKIIELEKQIGQLKSTASNSPLPQSAYNPQIQQMTQNLQSILTQTSHLPQTEEKVNQNKTTAPHPAKVIAVNPAKVEKTQPLLTTFPNVINGIVNDLKGNYLEGVIVIIHNKDNLPVRALKTNKLGQFTGATPLPVGVYTITLEKDNFTFDTLQINLNGEVMAPIQIQAKSG